MEGTATAAETSDQFSGNVVPETEEINLVSEGNEALEQVEETKPLDPKGKSLKPAEKTVPSRQMEASVVKDNGNTIGKDSTKTQSTVDKTDDAFGKLETEGESFCAQINIGFTQSLLAKAAVDLFEVKAYS